MCNNILIIAPSVVPRITTWGGSQRIYYLANLLVAEGKKVITVSPKHNIAETCKNKEVLYSPIYFGSTDTFNTKQYAGKWDKFKQMKVFRILKKLKMQLYLAYASVDYFFYSEPSRFEGRFYKKWLKQYGNEIYYLLERYAINQVIISGPSFVLFTAAKKIKERNKDIKVIFDYRDPWHLWKRRKNIAYLKEKQCLKYADCIVCFSKSFQEDMCKVFCLDKDKTKTVYNGYSQEFWTEVPDQKYENKKLVITYTGSIDFGDHSCNYRNPNRVMEAMREIPEGLVELWFIGVNAADARRDQSNIKYIGKVSLEESFGYMMRSDVLLNIHDTKDESGKYIVPGKFYDYMRSGKVIWNIGNENSLTEKIMKEYGLGISCRNSKDEISKVIMQLCRLKREGCLGKLRKSDKNRYAEFARENQNRVYLEVLNGL